MAHVIDFKASDPRPYAVGVVVLTKDRPHGEVILRRGEELFVVVEGEPIRRPGYRGPDAVFVIGEEVGGGKWPIMLVRARHPEAWSGLGSETASRMIARCRQRLVDEGFGPAENSPPAGGHKPSAKADSGPSKSP